MASTAPAQSEQGQAKATLSVVCMTAGPGERVAAILELLRPVATEIIVALDDRAEPDVLEDVATVADRLIEYPFADPVDRPLPWLFSQCRSDWMLTVDDDEVPSVALLEILPELCANNEVVHYSLARRWVYPTTETYLDEAPWRPDYQLRLFRTDPRLIRFSDALHRPIIPKGPGAFVREPLWHLDTVLRTRDERLAKAHEYERQRPGLRVDGRALNFAFYLPEARREAALAPVPTVDRTLIDGVLASGRPLSPARATVERVQREQIDASWPAGRGEQSGTLAIVAAPRSLAAGEQGTVDVRVTNTGSATWQWGRDAHPAVRCAAWWAGEDRTTAMWTPLPAPVAPGCSAIVPVHARAPESPGTHTLLLDLLHEDVRWFGCEVSCSVLVRPRRRVGFYDVGDDAIREMLAADPDLEPLVFAHAPRAGGEGYPEAPTPWRSLIEGGWSPSRAVFRGCRLVVRRGDDAFLRALASCDRLVVRRPTSEPRREAWCRTVTLLAARRLHVPVEYR